MNQISKDVLINNLLPYLQKETSDERMNRWVLQFVKWYSKNKNKRIEELDEYASFSTGTLRGENSVNYNWKIFAVYTADEMMPFDVYRKLFTDGSDIDVLLSGYRHIYEARELLAIARKKNKEEGKEEKEEQIDSNKRQRVEEFTWPESNSLLE